MQILHSTLTLIFCRCLRSTLAIAAILIPWLYTRECCPTGANSTILQWPTDCYALHLLTKYIHVLCYTWCSCTQFSTLKVCLWSILFYTTARQQELCTCTHKHQIKNSTNTVFVQRQITSAANIPVIH